MQKQKQSEDFIRKNYVIRGKKRAMNDNYPSKFHLGFRLKLGLS